MNKKSYNLIFLTFVLSAFFISCTKQNASFLKQGYHDVSARYNSNFNAKVKYKLTIKSIEDNLNENYDELLPLYSFGTPDDTKAKSGDFNIVIDKATSSIQLHQISNWSDDNFLLLGKAFYMQGEYKKAAESLRYITANYKEGVDSRSDKKKKKQRKSKKRKARVKAKSKRDIENLKEGKDIRPSKGFLKHNPAKSEALVWLVNTFTANEQFNEAQAALDYIALDNTFIKNYDRDRFLAHANYLINQNMFSEAIPHIENALELYKSNRKKSRNRYILAQLYQKVGNKTKASEYYEKSIKGNPKYDMVFNAKLNTLKLSGVGDDDKKDKLLAKLIKDSKNLDYLDQLYYERALITLNKKDYDSSKEFLAQSIESSTKNTRQKAKSHQLLAEILYDEPDYTSSQENYAACLVLITEDHPDYRTISKRAAVLTQLVAQLNIIAKNDSLLDLADMSQSDLESFLYNQAELSIETENQKNNISKNVDKFAKNDKVSKNSVDWYFYSSNAKNSGYNKFKANWGERKLEDDWRRNNKSTGSDIDEEIKTEDEIFVEKVEALYEQLLAEIPKDEQTKKLMKKDVATAHYTAANIYKYDLENEPKAIYHFNTIVKSFSKSEYDAESLYNLYLLNKEDNKTVSTKYKKLVLSKYPNSKYAKIINNPNYVENSKQESQEVELFYEETYNIYVEENFEKVIQRVSQSKTKFPKSTLEPKFALLEAITLGKQNKYKPYVDALEAVIVDFKDTEEEAKATELLAYLKEDVTKKDVKEPISIKETELETDDSSNSIFDANKGKENEGFKVNFGKKEILKVGINEEAEAAAADKNDKQKSKVVPSPPKKK